MLSFVSVAGPRTEPAKASLLRIIAELAPLLGVAHRINVATVMARQFLTLQARPLMPPHTAPLPTRTAGNQLGAACHSLH